MKNKIVRQLLTICMVVSLAVSTPMMSWANETETVEKKSNESDTINISEKGAKTSIYEDKKLTIAMESADYTLDASNIVLTLEIKNMYPNILTIKIQNAKVDNAQTAFKWDTNDYKAGDVCGSCWYIMLEDLQETNNTDFKQLSFTMTGTLNDGTEIFSKNIIIDRNAFKSLADEDDEVSEAEVAPEATEEVAEEPDKSVEMSDTRNDSDKDNSDIEARLSTLEENTKELEKKNEELESQYNDLKDENEKLKKQNKKLKKQVKELQTSHSEAESETQEEITPVAEPETTEVPAENTQPVTEAKDGTTAKSSDMNEEEIYEKAHKYAYKKYKYDKAAELLRTIEGYKDSTELAERYEQMNTNRYIGGRFYWYPDEYALLLKQNIKTLGDDCTSEVTNETVDENSETIDTITVTFEKEKITIVKLYDVKEDGSFKKIEISTENGSSLAYPTVVAISTARGDKDISEAKKLASDLLDTNPHGNIKKDGLLYTFDNDGLTMMVTIESEEQENKQKNSSSNDKTSESKASDSVSNSNIHYCEKDGCYKKGSHEVTGFSGQSEYYCDQHYQDIQDIIGMMEEDVGTGTASQHQCEVSGCSKEGTNSVGNEWYCTQHYQEMIDMLSGMYESTYGN